jgi:uncharacterized membrane protein YphA (DoxX/SURF4 family)
MKRLPVLTFGFWFLMFGVASAHEVYVLDAATIARDIMNPSPNPLLQIAHDPKLFIFWAVVGIIVVSTVFAMSITRFFEQSFSPMLNRLKPWATPIARMTLGACLVASSWNSALFGPELPLYNFGSVASLVSLSLFITGILVTVGLFTRYAGAVMLFVFALAVAKYGAYMTTYANYLGEILFVMIIGGGRFSLDHRLGMRGSALVRNLARKLEPYAFPILRILFGISIAFASYFAKFLHSQLALDVVTQYHLTNFFHFEPLFIVLGAFCVELLIGIFLIFGVEIRHTALFFLFWIFLSLLYFGEAVWPHLVLVGVLLALFCHGYDKLSLEGYYFKRGEREPVL